MLLERLGGFRHFDFGAELRAAASGRRGLPEHDVAFIRQMLERHALLPDERFDIAAKLLDAFLERTRFDPARNILVLNGLPRHVGQARAIASRVRIDHVIVLECDAETIRARLARRRQGNGLDHTGREDDSPEVIARKLAIYERETAPLIAHYATDPAVRVTRLRVTAETDDVDLHKAICGILSLGGRRGAAPEPGIHRGEAKHAGE